MRIEFDPTNPTEAAAVRAMLTAMAPASGGVVTSTENHLVGEVPSEQTTRLVIRADQFVVTNGAEEKPVLVNEDGVVLPQADSNGEPHDPRIHSTPPKLNADGTWRAKRGVKAEEIAAVRAEREALEADENSGPIEIKPEDFKAHVEEMTNGAATVDSSGEVVRTAPPAPPEPTGQSEAPLAPESATTVTVEASTLGSEAPTSHSFLDVMKAITAAQKDGKIDTAKVKELCAAVGAGESTMGLNGPDNGDKRGAFMRVVALDAEQRDAIIAAAKDAPGVATILSLLGDA